eukprot:gnl/Chilomastix_cuspidata/2202.p1 GENE.gnl/Chilomastix_cuspidata/2202~~gnl/Chilomastix_cuspidata/2202.p1  ORF type:complete len:613 (+),score=165.63 gnl/Chilomastix_cuspidata/2202:76-1914(+)
MSATKHSESRSAAASTPSRASVTTTTLWASSACALLGTVAEMKRSSPSSPNTGSYSMPHSPRRACTFMGETTLDAVAGSVRKTSLKTEFSGTLNASHRPMITKAMKINSSTPGVLFINFSTIEYTSDFSTSFITSLDEKPCELVAGLRACRLRERRADFALQSLKETLDSDSRLLFLEKTAYKGFPVTLGARNGAVPPPRLVSFRRAMYTSGAPLLTQAVRAGLDVPAVAIGFGKSSRRGRKFLPNAVLHAIGSLVNSAPAVEPQSVELPFLRDTRLLVPKLVLRGTAVVAAVFAVLFVFVVPADNKRVGKRKDAIRSGVLAWGCVLVATLFALLVRGSPLLAALGLVAGAGALAAVLCPRAISNRAVDLRHMLATHVACQALAALAAMFVCPEFGTPLVILSALNVLLQSTYCISVAGKRRISISVQILVSWVPAIFYGCLYARRVLAPLGAAVPWWSTGLAAAMIVQLCSHFVVLIPAQANHGRYWLIGFIVCGALLFLGEVSTFNKPPLKVWEGLEPYDLRSRVPNLPSTSIEWVDGSWLARIEECPDNFAFEIRSKAGHILFECGSDAPANQTIPLDLPKKRSVVFEWTWINGTNLAAEGELHLKTLK